MSFESAADLNKSVPSSIEEDTTLNHPEVVEEERPSDHSDREEVNDDKTTEKPSCDDEVQSQKDEEESAVDDSKTIPIYNPNATLTQEKPVFIPKVQVHEIVKQVPRLEVDWVDKRIEVTQLQYIDNYEDGGRAISTYVNRVDASNLNIQCQDTKYIKKPQHREIQQNIEVPSGEKILIPQLCPAPTDFIVPKFVDRNVPVIMSQTITPEVTETRDIIEVEMKRYVPEIVHIDVYIPKPINVPIRDTGIIDQRERPVDIDPKLLQQLTVELNPHLHKLEEFNQKQTTLFNRLCQESVDVSTRHGFVPPVPVTLPTVVMGECSGSYSLEDSKRIDASGYQVQGSVNSKKDGGSVISSNRSRVVMRGATSATSRVNVGVHRLSVTKSTPVAPNA